jgi:tetratricopeptide (TPR) repeat protein
LPRSISGAFAARGAVIGANAVLGAAQRLRSKVIGHAATLLQCGASELDLENGEIRYGDGRSTDLTIGKIARAVAPGGALFEGDGVRALLTTDEDVSVIGESRGRLDEAIAALRQTALIEPDFAQGCTNLANMLRAAGKFDEALEACASALKLHPNSSNALNVHANILLGQRDITGAIAAFREAIAADPNEAVVDWK